MYGNGLTVLVSQRLQGFGWSVNLCGVPDLESFLEAALLLPASITAAFDFPGWSGDGRQLARSASGASGSGHLG
jgi:hypothetical protein